MLNHKDDRAVSAEINDRLGKIIVRKLLTQKRALIRAMNTAIEDLEEMNRFIMRGIGEKDSDLAKMAGRLRRAVKRNSPKPALWE